MTSQTTTAYCYNIRIYIANYSILLRIPQQVVELFNRKVHAINDIL